MRPIVPSFHVRVPGWVVLVLLICSGAVDGQTENSVDPIRVGIIGLDTSHAIKFTSLMNESRASEGLSHCRVVAAYPRGSRTIESSVRRIPKYKKRIKKMGVEIVGSIKELLTRTDAIMLETNDGRLHLQQARPVLEAGHPLFIDKPFAASLTDAIAIVKEARQHETPVFSSSALRYAAGVQKVVDGSFGDVLGGHAYSPATIEPTHPDLYWYGIHGVEMLFAVMGTGCVRVRRSHENETDVVVGIWKDGRIGTFRGTRNGKHAYGGTVFGSRKNGKLGGFTGYKPLVTEIAKFFRTGQPPVKAEETLEIYAFMTAAEVSKEKGGQPVKIEHVLRKARERVKQRQKK